MTEEKEITFEDAKAVLDRDLEARMQQASVEINMVMEKYKLRLVPVPRISNDGRIVADFTFAQR